MREPPAPTLSEYRVAAIDLPVSMWNVCALHAACASFFIAVRLRPPTTFYECICPLFYTAIPLPSTSTFRTHICRFLHLKKATDVHAPSGNYAY
ncbi:hypothetical protein HYPSUDRAFT_39862 [Hypholoma sublateritium FD-334 SS-4]|uniref:Uncharacterized protein n=1 Tax=Hypholoma sublateritium (strain FD-334 SS-4) TaxID=945553 RepID=A0A0D2P3V6_HYPSF|nr:hypothetical protein HYPSUDRAFT_39862 [Hypholoma sublateritium FD-334 SS-4]